MDDLAGKTVIIAGAGPGLGRETALVAAREGANVVLGARTEATLRAVADEVDPTGERVAFAVTDVSSQADCDRLVAAAVQQFGRVDAVVNCAALDALFGGLEDAGDFSSWRAAFDVNLFGSLQMTRAALAELRKTRGSVVFVSSQTQHYPPPEVLQMGYASSKSALTGAMRHLANEVGHDGVRVNEIAPGWMWGPPVEGYVKFTAQQRGVGEDVVLGELTARMPLRRMATDGEVAEAIVFFASERAAGITGQTLLVNAGEIVK
ncbi:MAG: SDR family oxidoreductase [Actinobacteria bacterium]|nr:SDR family oxidoreductase [Actinomycetota bacterium]